MAKMKMTLDEKDIEAAIKEYVWEQYGMKVRSVVLRGTPESYDGPIKGNSFVTAEVECDGGKK